MTKLHKQRIKLWVGALRSGDYQQCRNNLRLTSNYNNSVTDGCTVAYCCLGVACAIYEKQTKKNIPSSEWGKSYLPNEVQKWLGLDKDDPYITKTLTAAFVNDERGWDFKKVANAIEKTYLKDKP